MDFTVPPKMDSIHPRNGIASDGAIRPETYIKSLMTFITCRASTSSSSSPSEIYLLPAIILVIVFKIEVRPQLVFVSHANTLRKEQSQILHDRIPGNAPNRIEKIGPYLSAMAPKV
ncbi:hypothetical protein QQP08_002704 [Theobroma cacao]|nr:hypothetical protein QQP08_002704 [Theobroma cacao]